MPHTLSSSPRVSGLLILGNVLTTVDPFRALKEEQQTRIEL